MILRWRHWLILAGFALHTHSAWAEVTLVEREQAAMQKGVARISENVVRIDTIVGLHAEKGTDDVDVVPAVSSSAVVIRPDGLALANRACVPDEVEGIVVTLPNGDKASADRIATDFAHELVLLKIQSSVTWREIETVNNLEQKVGMWTIAVGRGSQQSGVHVSVGILSAKDRLWGKAIQTDAKISPSNYGGALVDIQGRLLGVLIEAPAEASPEGGELYDSGIGFAIPLSLIQSALTRLEKGESVHPGLMGITLKGNDPFTSPAILGGTRPGGPARPAGLRAGDKIVAADGLEIERQAQLKQVLGRHVAGDTVRFTAERDSQRRDVELKLIEKLPAYERPMLGILPRRDDSGKDGVTIRAVMKNSAAAGAGLLADDRIVQMNDTVIASATELRQQLADATPGEEIKLKVRREKEDLPVTLKLGAWDDEPIVDLPPPGETREKEKRSEAKTGELPLPVAELDNEGTLYVPENYDAHVPHGILVWVSAEKNPSAKMLPRFRQICAKDHLIVIIPQPVESGKWKPVDAAYMIRAIDLVEKRYTVDAARVAVVGPGPAPYYATFLPRSKVTGLATIDGEMPRSLPLPETDPARQLSIYHLLTEKGKSNARVTKTGKRLIGAKYPVTSVNIPMNGEAPVIEAESIAQWVDGLDRM